jgi:hypothetical protein
MKFANSIGHGIRRAMTRRQNPIVNNAADTKPGDNHARHGRALHAIGAQQSCHVGKDTEQEYGFNEDRAETVFRHRIAEDRAIVRNQSRQVETAGLLPNASKPGDCDGERDEIDGAGKKEHCAPSKDITDHACPRRSEQVAAHRRKQQPTNRDLALLHRNAIAGDRQRNRKDATCGDACQHTERH